VDAGQVEQGVRRATDVLNREKGENPYLLHEALTEVMQKYVGIVRNDEDLATGIAEIEKLKARVENVKAPGASQYNPGWHEALSMRSLMIVSEAVARAGRMREESRGAHYRLDHPKEKEECLLFNVVIRKGKDGAMEVEKVERPPGPPHLVEIAQAKIEDLESGKVGGPQAADAAEDKT
jgi:succinate dehydrogenase / fumarate reductase flavoprotein subunit